MLLVTNMSMAMSLLDSLLIYVLIKCSQLIIIMLLITNMLLQGHIPFGQLIHLCFDLMQLVYYFMQLGGDGA